MNWPEQCAVIIPCLNEAATIAALVRDVRRQLSRVLVVDDGSTDATAALAAAAGAEVLRHERTEGKGAALQTGWQRARAAGCTWALTLDGDGQHAPADLPKFLACAEETGAALVIGNRMADAPAMPWLRRQVNRWMSRRIERLAGCPVPDSQCGFRLLRLDAWAAAPTVARHYEIESELLINFVRAGQRLAFVPVQVIYKQEQSKIHPLRDTGRWFRWWWRTRSAQPPAIENAARGGEALRDAGLL